jgi:hypothetical protein
LIQAYESLRTVGNLLLSNSDFRLFVGDLVTIGRQVFADTAFSLSATVEEAGKQIEPSREDTEAIQKPGADEAPAPTSEDLGQNASQVSQTVGNGMLQTGQDAVASIKDNLSGDQKDTLIYRLKQAVLKLRKRDDYSDSVSTISLLIQRYAMAYSRVVDETLNTTKDDIKPNAELDQAMRNFWSLLCSFGDRKEWELLEGKVKKVMEHSQKDPEFESLMTDVGNAIQKLLTDPDFFESAERKIEELREKSKKVGTDSTLRQDVDALLTQAQSTFHSVSQDKEVAHLTHTTRKILSLLAPTNKAVTQDLLTDALHIIFPLFIRTIQFIPIPRLEVSIPEMDLLLENLILEPGRTINNSSFLPYKLNISTKNDLSIRKTHSKRTVSSMKTLITVSITGLTLSAQDLGFWIRVHSGFLFRFADEGIASFALDERGIDITLQLELGREKLERILSLRNVKVHIHKLDYKFAKSRLSWIANWVLKPFLKQLIRRSLEKTIAEAIAEGLCSANRELVFARERLRATRIADPQDIATFVKAVTARLTPEEDPDTYTRVGIEPPGGGVFKGVYAPGSIVKLWEEEARRAEEIIEDGDEEGTGWRNPIFDVGVMAI